MGEDGAIRDELIRLTQTLVVEGAKVVEAFAARHGLHHTDVEALTRVMAAQERGAPMTAGALAEELALTSGAVTAVVDRLERAGHVSRVRDGADRRKVLLHHSPGGRALAEDFFAPARRRSEAAMDHFTPEELEVVRRFLTVTSAAMAAHRATLVREAATNPTPGGRPTGRA